MQVDILGRINNVNLSYSKALLPLFEAVVNSIHAIEDANIPDGKINIYVERDDTQLDIEPDQYEQYPISSFKIVDNGIGFDENNYNSFLTADSTYKAQKGAKGIGRFIWLKAFNQVHIESNFTENDKMYFRVFDFTRTATGIENHQLEEIEETEKQTTVHLQEFMQKFQHSCPRRTAIIANRLVEHTLVYFLSSHTTQILLHDHNQVLSLNNIFDENFGEYKKEENVTIRNNEFRVTHLKLYASEENNHLIHFCANNRDVLHENLSKHVKDLSRKIKDEDEKAFVYSSYVAGQYLDKHVNSERTAFNIPQNGDSLFEEDISREELTGNFVEISKQHLKTFLEKVQEDKSQQIETYVRTKAPQYRALLSYKDEFIESIAPELSEDKLDLELHKASHSIEIRLKEQSQDILKTDLKDVTDLEDYKARYKEFISKFNEFGKSRLAEYILHRKVILDMFSKKLELDRKTDKYSLEESVHEIIFPLKKSSDDIDYERQNLWIIDEKLSYHKYLASDKPLNQMEILETDEQKRPDIIIFNEPFAFVEDTPPFSSIVIIEFKRPLRDDYDADEDNPIAQIYGYVEKIMDNRALDNNGRPVIISENTPFYGYIISDLTPKLNKVAVYYNLTKAPDSMGFFGYNKDLKTYIEIISYDKLLNDAKKRNRILFDKLNLPIS